MANNPQYQRGHSLMEYKRRWRLIDELGEGGQGKVYRVLDGSKFEIDNRILPEISQLVNALTTEKDAKSIGKHFNELRHLLSTLNEMENPKNHGALKLLHSPADARDYGLSHKRISREIKAMNEVKHLNLLRILDYNVGFDYERFVKSLGSDDEIDPKPPWFVSEFHPKGTLMKNKERFIGDFVCSLRAFRPLVEGVSKLHRAGFVHRDIKPENIFLDSSDNLVLGDFGLVFFSDERHTRISAAFENVGSRDWMPAWAMGMRIEDVEPTFDVFSLGKVLWFMVANKPILRLWYYLKDEFNLEKIFPDTPYINLANHLFKKCIVEEEQDCLPDATAFLEEVDKLLSIINRNADLISKDIERVCRVCGIGKYVLKIDTDSASGKLHNFGLKAVSGQYFKIFICNNCGHVQFFSFPDKERPPAWPD